MGRRTCGPYQAKVRKEEYAKQFARTLQNRRRKRQKHLSLHPKDIQALEALKKLL